MAQTPPNTVIPAQAGTYVAWVPACAGMTVSTATECEPSGVCDPMPQVCQTGSEGELNPPYPPPIRAPFSATERFISSTTNTSATMITAATQNTSK